MKQDFVFSFRLNPKKSLVAVLIASSLTFLTVKCGVSRKDILKLYNEIRKSLIFDLPDNHIINEIDDQLNRRINNDPELLDFKVRGEVNDAIHEYKKWEQKNYVPNMKNEIILKEIKSPKYTETQKQILKDAIYYEFDDGTMGIRGAWVLPDPREINPG